MAGVEWYSMYCCKASDSFEHVAPGDHRKARLVRCIRQTSLGYFANRACLRNVTNTYLKSKHEIEATFPLYEK